MTTVPTVLMLQNGPIWQLDGDKTDVYFEAAAAAPGVTCALLRCLAYRSGVDPRLIIWSSSPTRSAPRGCHEEHTRMYAHSHTHKSRCVCVCVISVLIMRLFAIYLFPQRVNEFVRVWRRLRSSSLLAVFTRHLFLCFFKCDAHFNDGWYSRMCLGLFLLDIHTFDSVTSTDNKEKCKHCQD